MKIQPMNIREAKQEDIPKMHQIRISVKENTLSNPNLISEEDYIDFITNRGKGWVAEIMDNLVGFAIIDVVDKNVWALFVDPNFEGKGMGKQLHYTMLDWYFQQTDETIWLGTSPNTKAEQFYRNFGWKEIGMNGDNEIKFEMTKQNWINYGKSRSY